MLQLVILAACTVQVFGQEDSVAIIIGGYTQDNDGIDEVLGSVEVFGCSGEETLPLEDFPVDRHGLAGVYLPAEEALLVCGGDTGELSNNLRSECFQWTQANGWKPVRAMPTERSYHLLALRPDRDGNFDTSSNVVAIGGLGNPSYDTDLYEYDLGIWTPHGEMPYNFLDSQSCLIQHGNKVIFINNELKEGYGWYLYEWKTASVNGFGLYGAEGTRQRCMVTSNEAGFPGKLHFAADQQSQCCS